MQTFFMRGKAITGAVRFREYFSPRDLLRERELCAAFLNHQYRYLSDRAMYHTNMFFRAVFLWENHQDFQEAGDFCMSYMVIGNQPREIQRQELRRYFSLPGVRERLEWLWDLSRKTGLEEDDKQRLFCLLASAYALADKTREECPLTSAEAESAYLRREDRACSGGWLTFADAGEIRLAARQEPYRVLLGRDAGTLLEGGVIRPRRLTALPDARGRTSVPVTLELYRSPDDREPEQVRFFPGDYRYANFVGSTPVFFHPAETETDACRICRRVGSLELVDKQRVDGDKSQVLNCAGVGVIGFAPEQNSAGWLVLYDQLGLDDHGYSHRLNYKLPKNGIVQVLFRDSDFLLLDENGFVHTPAGRSGTRTVSLADFQREDAL